MSKGYHSVNLHGCANGVIPTPVIGENGNWFVGNDDTGVNAKGEQGEPGPEGPQGSKGDQGDTPELVANLEQTETGKALDATMGKALNDSLGGLSFSIVNGEPCVKVGADSPRPFNSTAYLVWTNPSPTAIFTPQTIQLDLSKYKQIIVIYRLRQSDGGVVSQLLINVGNTQYAGSTIGGAIGDEGNGARVIKTTTSYVYFGNATRNNSVENGWILPVKIYGLKREIAIL